MSRPLQRTLLIAGGADGLLLFAALAFVDVNHFKPRVEAAASNALGMDVRIGGRLGLGFFPGFQATAGDAQILDPLGVVVASAKRVTLEIQLLPLVHGEFRLDRIELTQPRLTVERDSTGRLSIEKLKQAVVLLGALDGARVSLSNGDLLYADHKSGAGFAATDIDLEVSRIRLAGGNGTQRLKGLSLVAKLTCKNIQLRGLAVTDVAVSVDGTNGVFALDPVTLRIFDGQATASLHANVSGPVALYQVRCSLPRFRIESFLGVLSPKRAAAGAMDFTANLSMQGRTGRELIRTAAGQVSLRGTHLTLVGIDIDGVLSRLASSQNFNLVDVGVVFLAGPMGLAVTRGYGFASLFQGAGGSSSVGTLISEWHVEHGVAQAQDVALATARSRLALQGGLDFVDQRFADVTVAVIDAGGSATLRQTIRGSFKNPTVEKPHAITALAGPLLRLYRRTRALFPARPCEVFYAGAVAAPER